MTGVEETSDSVVRWSSRDPEAQRGDPFFDIERPTGAGQRALTTMGGTLGMLVSLADDVADSFDREDFVAVGSDGVLVKDTNGHITVAWTDLETAVYSKKLGDAKGRPIAVLRLVDGSTVPLPNTLYPDAVGDFSSMRHTERARAIVDSINRNRPSSSRSSDSAP